MFLLKKETQHTHKKKKKKPDACDCLIEDQSYNWSKGLKSYGHSDGPTEEPKVLIIVDLGKKRNKEIQIYIFLSKN